MTESRNDHEKYLITGVAGFIGFYLARYLLEAGCGVAGIDNINDYYDINLKNERLSLLRAYQNFEFIQGDITDRVLIEQIFARLEPKIVVHLAAQAGVRYSLENPEAYIQANIVGHFNILEACRKYPVRHLVYASSSSVYGSNEKVPFSEDDPVDHPVSLYAATKKADELMSYTYSHLYGIPATGLRFFTVYGPMGRPDMAYYAFVTRYFAGQPIEIYNGGNFAEDLSRDFTYIDDVVRGISGLLDRPPQSGVPHIIYNVGNNCPEKLMTFITTLEECLSRSLGRKVEFKKRYAPLKAGDVPATFADIGRLATATGFRPETPINIGLQHFTDWYVKYYKLA